jgi:AcrR family transcriptional regulator
MSYRAGSRRAPSDTTRTRVLAAVRALLEEGSFHRATVEDVAVRAGVSRASLYQHFGSRLGLIDAICETLGDNSHLHAIFEAVAAPDPVVGMEAVLVESVRFWADDEALHRHLYALAEIDDASAAFVRRQTEDRLTRLKRFVQRLAAAGVLRSGTSDALATLLLLTSFGAYVELRRSAGMSQATVERMVVSLASSALLKPER